MKKKFVSLFSLTLSVLLISACEENQQDEQADGVEAADYLVSRPNYVLDWNSDSNRELTSAHTSSRNGTGWLIIWLILHNSNQPSGIRREYFRSQAYATREKKVSKSITSSASRPNSTYRPNPVYRPRPVSRPMPRIGGRR